MNTWISIASLVLSTLTLGLLTWMLRLRAADRRREAREQQGDVMSREAKAALKKSAAEQYEATMVRELAAFEKQLADVSAELIAAIKADVATESQRLNDASKQLTKTVSEEYHQLLTHASEQLKAHLLAADQQLETHNKALAESLDQAVAARRAVVIDRVETDLADILGTYLAGVAGQLDLSGQEQFIMAQLETIKGPLKEDLSRAN